MIIDKEKLLGYLIYELKKQRPISTVDVVQLKEVTDLVQKYFKEKQ